MYSEALSFRVLIMYVLDNETLWLSLWQGFATSGQGLLQPFTSKYQSFPLLFILESRANWSQQWARRML